MNCRRLAGLLPELVENELDELTTREARDHIASCAACASEAAGYELALGALRCEWRTLETPPALSSIDLHLTHRRTQWGQLVLVGNAMIAVLLLAFVAPWMCARRTAQPVTPPVSEHAMKPDAVPANPAAVEAPKVVPAAVPVAIRESKPAAKRLVAHSAVAASSMARHARSARLYSYPKRNHRRAVSAAKSRPTPPASRRVVIELVGEATAAAARMPVDSRALTATETICVAAVDGATAVRGDPANYALRRVNERDVHYAGTGVKEYTFKPSYEREQLTCAASL